MAKQVRTIGISIIQVALSLYLTITGVCLLVPNNVLGNESSAEIQALTHFLKNENVIRVVDIVFGAILVVCAVLMLIKAITQLAASDNKGVDFRKVDDIARRIVIVLWVIISLVALCYYVASAIDNKTVGTVLYCILSLAKNALIIGGLLTIKDGK